MGISTARHTKTRSVGTIIEETVREVITRTVAQIANALADVEWAQRRNQRVAGRRKVPSRRPRPVQDLTRWVADKRARRVPKFVIVMTGLDTKKKIVARFGEDVVFVKGKPLPQTLSGAHAKPANGKRPVHAAKAKRSRAPTAGGEKPPSEAKVTEFPQQVKARPPIVRKASAARAG